jgi:hypothetical protein
MGDQVALPWLPDPASSGAVPGEVDLRLARKGRREPLGGLLEQARHSVGLARKHAAALARAGWPAARTDGLEADVLRLEGLAGAHAELGRKTRTKADAEQRAIDDAKRFLRVLRAALPMALRDAEPHGPKPEAFRVGRELRRSVAQIAVHLGTIREAVQKLDPALAPYFGGKKPSATLAKVRAALETADTAHDEERRARVPVTWQAYEARGRVVQDIEDLQRVARIVFDGKPELRKAFGKEILERARKKRAPKPT